MSGTGHDASAQLTRMANDIGNFFRSEPQRAEAVAGIANHITKYWTPRMRQKLMAHVQKHGMGELNELPQEAMKMLAQQQLDGPAAEPAGDAAG
jgi:formate dehydrogenase subunit delta